MEKLTAILLTALMCVNVVPKTEASAQCDAQALSNLDQCCDMPKLLKYGIVQNCLKELNIEAGKINAESSACIVDCMFRNETFVGKDGILDPTKILEVFGNAVSKTWKPIVTDAVTNCSQELRKILPINTKPQPGCNPRPALFMSCVGRYLALECPTSSKTEAAKSGTCVEKLDHLRECNPFALDEVPVSTTTTKAKSG